MQSIYTGGVKVQGVTEISRGVHPNDVNQVTTEDYRSDRLILEEISAEVGRLHQRLDAFEPYMPLLHRWFAMRQALGRSLGGMRHG